MKAIVHPDLAELRLDQVLHALADPLRLAIVRRLAREGALSCATSCDGLPTPRATLSRHYDVLRRGGIVWTTRDGVHYRNVLRRADLDRRFPGLLAALLAQSDGAAACPGVAR